MAVYDTLRTRGNLWGTYVRPPGSDSYPPPAGTKVLWVCSQPIQDLLDQGKQLGWANKGTIGNTTHLRGHGDHTGHSAGKLGGILYAKDTWCSQASLNALLQLCRDPGYDTSWIDFFNALGSQYNYAGKRVGSSSDQHLHVSVKRGQELRRVTLFADMAAVMAGTYGERVLPVMPAIFRRLGFIDDAVLVQVKGDPKVWLTGRGKKAHVASPAELKEIQAYMTARGMTATVAPVVPAELAALTEV